MNEINTDTAPKTDDEKLILDMARKAREASLIMATQTTESKNAVLETLASLLESNVKKLTEANEQDLLAAKEADLPKPMQDRLALTPARIADMVTGVRDVVALPDPVGEEIEHIERPNGLKISKVRTPVGVIGIIYESRPNVTIDCATLCIKSGNACILRGGKESLKTNVALAEIIRQALSENNVTTDVVQLVPTTDREVFKYLLKMDAYIHCIIPRGGEALIRFVTENSRIPVIKHFKGVCNIYVDEEADPDMAEKIIVNAKTQRPGVCNAVENLFIHQSVMTTLLPRIAKALDAKGVELRIDSASEGVLLATTDIALKPLREEDLYEEFLDLILAVKVVNSCEAAIRAVNQYGSMHSDAIITANKQTAEKFMAGVDSATVYWNASTRFTDGFEFGLGAEIGISTDKLHARGPMGLRELCTYKYLIYGTGQIK